MKNFIKAPENWDNTSEVKSQNAEVNNLQVSSLKAEEVNPNRLRIEAKIEELKSNFQK